MLLPRSWLPARAATSSVKAPRQQLTPSTRALEALRTAALAPLSLTFVRYATHQSEGRANGAKDGHGRRLGAKKTGEEWVIPGNIIFRQRGTNWHPGENVGMGRDHTLFALQSGYVKYYRDPLKHPKRQYIGVVFNRNDTLPYPPNAARKRRLGMLAVQMNPERSAYGSTTAGDLTVGRKTGQDTRLGDVPAQDRVGQGREHAVMRRGYSYREANWQIGRTAEKAGIKVQKFKPGNRFLAWRKSKSRIAKNIEKRAIRKRKK